MYSEPQNCGTPEPGARWVNRELIHMNDLTHVMAKSTSIAPRWGVWRAGMGSTVLPVAVGVRAASPQLQQKQETCSDIKLISDVWRLALRHLQNALKQHVILAKPVILKNADRAVASAGEAGTRCVVIGS